MTLTRIKRRVGLFFVVLGVASMGLVGSPRVACANQRHFTFTYETATLPAGAFELEPWATARIGRQQYYTGIDYSLEFEGGLTDHLQTALYLNGTTEGAVSGGSFQSSSAFTGVSSEWKLQILDGGIAPLGLALYGEATLGPSFFEAEGKLLLDRRFGRVILAANIVVDHDWTFSAADTQRQLELEIDLAAGYQVTSQVTLGVEVRNWNHWVLTPEVLQQDSVFYAGPSIAFGARSYWLAASVLPQLGALVGASAHDSRNLTSQESVDVRILMGAHF